MLIIKLVQAQPHIIQHLGLLKCEITFVYSRTLCPKNVVCKMVPIVLKPGYDDFIVCLFLSSSMARQPMTWPCQWTGGWVIICMFFLLTVCFEYNSIFSVTSTETNQNIWKNYRRLNILNTDSTFIKLSPWCPWIKEPLKTTILYIILP